MHIKFFAVVGSVALLTLMSSCAVSMKMQGNRFESSEVYGRTAARINTAYDGQANVELTPDYTDYEPNTNNPDNGPTHIAAFGVGMGIKDRLEIGFNSNGVGHAKFQLLGDPKIRAKEGNFSLSVVGSLGYNSDDEEGSGLVASDVKSHIEYTTFGGQLVAGYRPDRLVNFYFGPFWERGNYTGTYQIVGNAATGYGGQATNAGGVIGMEIGSPRVSGIFEGAWNHTTSGSSKNDYWVGGAEVVVSFGSVKVSDEPKSSVAEL